MDASLVVSIIALVISATTAWFTIFHKGVVKMTRPQFFALLPEDSPFNGWIKFFMRSLLYSTGRRGRVIENMYLVFAGPNETLQFEYWMYGRREDLEIGSGVFVGHEGISLNHHFVPTRGVSVNAFPPGEYNINVFALLLGDKVPALLHSVKFILGEDEAHVIRTRKNVAIYFTWDKQSNSYRSKVDEHRKDKLSPF